MLFPNQLYQFFLPLQNRRPFGPHVLTNIHFQKWKLNGKLEAKGGLQDMGMEVRTAASHTRTYVDTEARA